MKELELFSKGMDAYQQGDYASAIETLTHLVNQKDLPGKLSRYYCAMSHKGIALELLKEGRFSESAKHLNEAIALIGNKADLLEYLLAAYAADKKYEQYARKAEVLSRIRTNEITVRVRLAGAQWHVGRRVEAIMTLTEALRKFGNHAELHMNLGLFYASEENFDLAARHLYEAVRCDCTSVDAYRYLGLIESARKNFYRAAEAFQRAYTLAPNDLMLAYYLSLSADAAYRNGQPVIISIPEMTPSSVSMSDKEDSENAPMRQLAEYVAREPDFVETFLTLPQSQTDKELFGVLVAVIKSALQNHPNYADLHYYAAVALDRLGKDDEAIEHLTRAVEINPSYTKALIYLSDIYISHQEDANAIATLEQAISAGADYPDVHVRLAKLMSKIGRFNKAREHYARALKLNRNYREAADGVASLAA